MATDVQVLMPFPHPREHEVHIHCLSLSGLATLYISPDEQFRADQLLNPDKQRYFIASHGLLRTILGGYLGKQPQDLHFRVGEHGKPSLWGDDAWLHFNLSHSDHLFLLAIASDREVGIDVEQLRDDTPFAKMAQMTFSPREQAGLFSLPHHLQRSTFYRCWTRKEAYLKACGTGFSVPSNSFDVSLLQEEPARVITPESQTLWYLQEINVPAGFCATLAVPESIADIRYMT